MRKAASRALIKALERLGWKIITLAGPYDQAQVVVPPNSIVLIPPED